jgi:uncharacterized protein (DUF4213/DUF364 family)
MTKNIYVFELNPAKGSGFYAPEDMPKHLPKCSHVLITASAIINHTIDEILSLCGGNKKAVYLVGPSAPLWPEAFGGAGNADCRLRGDKAGFDNADNQPLRRDKAYPARRRTGHA